MTENVPLFIVAKTVLDDKEVIAFAFCLQSNQVKRSRR